MASLINDDSHISNAANNMGSYRVIKGWVNGIGYLPDSRLMLYLEQAGFGPAALIRTFDLRYDLTSALLLGDSPNDDESNFTSLKFTWLKAKFGQLLANATESVLMCAARAYIMHIIGGVLMPDANNNKVHMMYLSLLADLTNVSSYSWGSAVLAVLYREFCRTTKPSVVDMGRCLTLQQS
ncbi:protein MAIN-LIKE 1-like [Gossypium raimondii]|uniref:protein MAIN-LIKE 1-like n=1 Tax=Gossypium raimondii TaxID=29730 RepID=UPI00227CBB5A|nr:protein MAIN-LIKE 1-like [Gossypium raimondii]